MLSGIGSTEHRVEGSGCGVISGLQHQDLRLRIWEAGCGLATQGLFLFGFLSIDLSGLYQSTGEH